MLKNDTLKKGTSRIGLCGSAPPGTDSSAHTPIKVLIVKFFLQKILDLTSFVVTRIAVS